jgi:ribose transport system permease protein
VIGCADILRAREFPALALLVLALVWLGVFKPAFRTPDNLAVVAQDAGILGIMAAGEAVVILTGGVDLSVGSALALSACGAGALIMMGVPWPLAGAVAILLGACAGWINGALVTHRRLPPILVTLSTLLLFRGLTNVATGAAPYNLLPEAFKAMGKGFMPLGAMLIVGALFALMQSRARFGRHLMAVGGSPSAARLSGLKLDVILRRTYLTAGLCAALAGLFMAAANGNAQWTLADGWELDVIAATVIGGVRLTGGEGSIVGAMLGALIIVVMRNALFLSGVPGEQYGLVTGAVIVIAALAEQWRRYAARSER